MKKVLTIILTVLVSINLLMLVYSLGMMLYRTLIQGVTDYYYLGYATAQFLIGVIGVGVALCALLFNINSLKNTVNGKFLRVTNIIFIVFKSLGFCSRLFFMFYLPYGIGLTIVLFSLADAAVIFLAIYTWPKKQNRIAELINEV